MPVLCLLSAWSLAATAEPLSLDKSLAATAEFNRELIRARDRVEEIQGDHVVVRSRFMPHLSLTATYDAQRTAATPGGETDDTIGSRLQYSQRLFEFGPDAGREIRLRADLRTAVFAYEDKVHEVLSRVWEVFHLILLQELQIESRRSSRDSFQAALERQEARFEKRLASEEDKLNAELNVLNEELAINRLVRQQFNNKMELLRLIGRPIGTEVQVEGELKKFPVNQDDAVAIALRRDVQLALREEQLEEQRRVVREVNWEYSPDLTVNAGVEDGRKDAKINVDREDGTWGVDLESGFELNEEAEPQRPEDTQWTAQVEARIPIFEGGSRLGLEAREKAKLRQIMVEIRDLRAGVDLQVRQAYQSMLEADEEQRIQEQRVTIARRRLEINQFLKDKGKADEAKLEQVRDQFFREQDRLFGNQATHINRQASLRRLMGFTE